MWWFSSDPNEPGVFAVGQEAYGVFAFGQMATGVIAIGQLGLGVVAIGQGAVGLLAVGQGAVGVYAGLAMVGIFGRGFPLSVIPKLPRPRQLPPTTDTSQVRWGYGDGWIAAELGRGAEGFPVLVADDSTLPDIRLSARLRANAEVELQRASTKVIAHVRRVGDDLVCDRLLHVPLPLREQPGFHQKMALRMLALTAMAVGFWFAVGDPILEMFR